MGGAQNYFKVVQIKRLNGKKKGRVEKAGHNSFWLRVGFIELG